MLPNQSTQTGAQQGTTSGIQISVEEQNLSLVGGSTLLVMAVASRSKWGALLGAAGTYLLFRGITGRSLEYRLLNKNTAVHNTDAAISVPHQQGIHVVQSVVINRPHQEVYRFWRDFSNLPRFMNNVESVTVKTPTRSHWRVKGPAGTNIEWDAEIVNDEENKVIGWRTLDNPVVDHAGSVRFRPSSGNQNTQVTVEMEYVPLGGKLGTAIASIFNANPEKQIEEDLERLKQYLEAGQMANIDGQTSPRP